MQFRLSVFGDPEAHGEDAVRFVRLVAGAQPTDHPTGGSSRMSWTASTKTRSASSSTTTSYLAPGVPVPRGGAARRAAPLAVPVRGAARRRQSGPVPGIRSGGCAGSAAVAWRGNSASISSSARCTAARCSAARTAHSPRSRISRDARTPGRVGAPPRHGAGGSHRRRRANLFRTGRHEHAPRRLGGEGGAGDPCRALARECRHRRADPGRARARRAYGTVHPLERRELAEFLATHHALGSIDLHTWEPPLATAVGERPVASALARIEMERGVRVTSLRHRQVEIDDPMAAALLVRLDGPGISRALHEKCAGRCRESPSPAITSRRHSRGLRTTACSKAEPAVRVGWDIHTRRPPRHRASLGLRGGDEPEDGVAIRQVGNTRSGAAAVSSERDESPVATAMAFAAMQRAQRTSSGVSPITVVRAGFAGSRWVARRNASAALSASAAIPPRSVWWSPYPPKSKNESMP